MKRAAASRRPPSSTAVRVGPQWMENVNVCGFEKFWSLDPRIAGSFRRQMVSPRVCLTRR